MKVIFHIVLPTGEAYYDTQEIRNIRIRYPNTYFIQKYPDTPKSDEYRGYIVAGIIGTQILYYDHHLFSSKSNPQRIGELINFVVKREDPHPVNNIRDRMDELEKGMLIKTKQIAILEAKVAAGRPPRLIRYACHGCEAECRTSAYDSTEIKTKCPYPIWVKTE